LVSVFTFDKTLHGHHADKEALFYRIVRFHTASAKTGLSTVTKL